MRDYNYCRVTSTLLGLTCAGLGSYGAFEFAYRLEGTMSYLVIAAPVVAVTAALIPPIAEATWRAGGFVKALLWWAVLVPAGAVVFFSSAERVHDAKAGAEAERGALRGAAARASVALLKAQAELAMARADANGARAKGSVVQNAERSLPQRRRPRLKLTRRSWHCSRRSGRPRRRAHSRLPHGCCQRHSMRSPSWRSGRASRAGRPGSLATNLRRGGGVP
jgi:hypothetical protein